MSSRVLVPVLAAAALAAALGVWAVLGRGSALQVSPESVDFGAVALGSEGRQIVIATNLGSEPIEIERMAAEAPFRISHGNLSLAPGQSAELVLTFRPGESGIAEGVARFERSGVGRGATVSLTGLGQLPPDVAVDPLSISFGEVEVGAIATGNVQIGNRGEAELRVDGIATGKPFAVAVTEMVVGPGERHDVAVRFEPGAVGDFRQLVQVRTNDPRREAIHIEVTGSGVAERPLADIEVSPLALSFGDASCELQEQHVAVRNAGSSLLTLTSLALPAPFYVPGRSRVLEPGEQLRIPITFAPQVLGSRRATLSIHSNDPAERIVQVTLSGESSPCVATKRAAEGAVEVAESWRKRRASATASLTGGGSSAGAAGEPGSGAPDVPGGTTPPGEDAAQGNGDEPSAPLPVVSIEEGSFVRVGSYNSDLSSADVGGIEYDPATGRIDLRELRLPVIEAALGEYFQFSMTDAVGQFDSLGEAELALPIEMVDGWGNPTPMNLTLTTGISTALVDGGQLISATGQPLGASGVTRLVALATFPPGSPFEGQAMRIMLNVKVR
jgi:hypothetical protein